MGLIAVNPKNGEVIREYEEDQADVVAQKIEEAHQAWHLWRKSSFDQRRQCMTRLAAVLRARRQELAELMADEMGKPVSQGLAEVEKCAMCCEYYAEQAENHLSDRIIKTESSKSYVTFQPTGVLLAVMPWNFPLWQVFRFLAPALMAGNCGVLKHASNVPGSALAIEELVRQAGFPEHVFRTLLIGSSRVKDVITHPLIRGVALTGSNQAGVQVATLAGSVLKKTVLELGGSDAYVVLEDADLDWAAETCATSRLTNSGQSCIAAKRFVVVESVLEAFTDRLVAKMKAKKVGDPRDPGTEVGPQARMELRDELHQQVLKSIELGAVCRLGGELTPGLHAYYPPTVLTQVRPGMPAYEEELFGPVAAVIPAKDEQDAIRIANDSIYGLGSAVFTRDVERGERICKYELQAGSSFVNARIQSDPRLPFGGIKDSGYGRELGEFGIWEFVNVKTVVVG